VETKDTTICSGQAFILPGGMVATTPGIYTDTLKAVAGCDSVIYVITLSVQSIKRDTLEASFCEGSSFALPWGEVVTISGIYQDTVTGISGCDSLIQRVELGINTVLIKEDSVNICPGTSYTLPWGPVTSSNGVYKDTLHYNNGCDSLVQIVRVTVLPVFRQNMQASFCAGSSYTLPWGITTNIPGLYTDTGRYSTGCDSVIRVVDLQLNAITRENDSLILCPGKSYTLPWGLEITSAGLYSDTVKGKGGCDSVVRTVTVIEANTLIQKDTVFFCAGSSYTLPWGHVVSMQGAYSDTIRYSTGCDSLIQTIYLEQSPGPIYETLDATFCSGQSYTLPWGLVVNATGVYHDTIKAAGGCDSLIRKASINFTPASTTTIDTSICFGGQYVLPSGTSVNATGIYRDTAKAIGGCDSLIIITKLVVLAPTQQTTNIVINEGESYTLPWGTVVTTPGIYRDTLYYQRGCDSVLRSVNVSLANIPLVSIKESFCSGGSYTLPWGQVVSSTGTYRDTLSGTNGADSLIMEVILSHQVTQSQTGSASFCEGSTYTLPWGLLVTKAGIYRDTLKTAGGCDSLVRVVDLALEAAPFVTLNKSNDVTCTASSARLTATGGSAYKWWPSESLDNATISDPLATPLESTVYHVQVTTATGCQSEDSITVYVTTGDNGNNYLVPNAFTPDGDGKNDCFGIKHWGPVTELSFTIYDRWGGIVFQTSDPSRCWDGTGKTSLLPTGSFVYFIKAKTMCGPVMRKGTVTLVR
jgi:gliding motility-associated-like protein